VQLRNISKPSALIQDQIRDLERKRERLLRHLQTDDKPAEEEPAKVEDLLRRVLNPTLLNLENLITGKREAVTIRDTRALLKLLKRDVEAGRAVLRSLVENVTLRPVGEDVEVTIMGTLGNVLSGWLTAEGVIPFSDQTRKTPDQMREIVVWESWCREGVTRLIATLAAHDPRGRLDMRGGASPGLSRTWTRTKLSVSRL
jgi:hypothetical protein